MSFKEIFYPTKKKLAVFIFILFTASFPLYGTWSGNVTTYDQDRSPWINQLMMVWSFTSIIGGILQSPVGFLAEFLPVSGQAGNVLFTFAILVNSYLLGSLIGAIWEIKKTLQDKNYLRVYISGLFFAVLGMGWLGISESSNDALLIICVILVMFLAVLISKRFAPKIFMPVLIITILFMFGFFGLALSDFEESYCWNREVGPGLEFSDHIDCHTKFDLMKAISETYN